MTKVISLKNKSYLYIFLNFLLSEQLMNNLPKIIIQISGFIAGFNMKRGCGNLRIVCFGDKKLKQDLPVTSFSSEILFKYFFLDLQNFSYKGISPFVSFFIFNMSA